MANLKRTHHQLAKAEKKLGDRRPDGSYFYASPEFLRGTVLEDC